MRPSQEIKTVEINLSELEFRYLVFGGQFEIANIENVKEVGRGGDVQLFTSTKVLILI